VPTQPIDVVAAALAADFSAPSPPRRWFYMQPDERFGPITAPELRAAVRMGFLGPDDVVRCGRVGPWFIAGAVTGLFDPPLAQRSIASSHSNVTPDQPSRLPHGDHTMPPTCTPYHSFVPRPPHVPASAAQAPSDSTWSSPPPIYVSPRIARRRTSRMPLFEVVLALGCLGIVGYVAHRLVDRVTSPTVSRPMTATTTSRIKPATGGGIRARSSVASRPPKVTPKITASASPSAASPHDASDTIAAGLKACKEGLFDLANEHGAAAAKAAPEDPRGFAIQVLAAYAPQYSMLADEAAKQMNGSTEVDLGRQHGLGAFVEQTPDHVVFIAKGRHVRFTLAEFNNLYDVRFRITRAFLDNGKRPANDLILGAIHFLKQLDADGNLDLKSEAPRTAAQDRWKAAAGSGDTTVAGHAQALLTLLETR